MKKKWYERKEVQAVVSLGLLAVSQLPEVASYAVDKLAGHHTLLYQLKVPAIAILGGVWSALGLRGLYKGYKSKNLPLQKLPGGIDEPSSKH